MTDDDQKITVIRQALSRNKLRLKFTPELEAEFRSDYSDKYYRHLAIGVCLGASLYVFGAIIAVS